MECYDYLYGMNNANNNTMKVTLKHTTDVTTDIVAPNAFGQMPKGYKARKFNTDRLKSIIGMTDDAIKHLSNVVMLKEGEGDAWTAITTNNLGCHYDNSTWISVQMTIVECAQEVVNKF